VQKKKEKMIFMIKIMCACVIDIVLILQQFFSFLFFEVICKKKLKKK